MIHFLETYFQMGFTPILYYIAFIIRTFIVMSVIFPLLLVDHALLSILNLKILYPTKTHTHTRFLETAFLQKRIMLPITESAL